VFRLPWSSAAYPTQAKKRLEWGTHHLLPVHRKFEVVTTAALNPLPVPAANAGCPIQAAFWLEWDRGTRPREVDGQTQQKATNPVLLARVLFNPFSKLLLQQPVRPLIWAALILSCSSGTQFGESTPHATDKEGTQGRPCPEIKPPRMPRVAGNSPDGCGQLNRACLPQPLYGGIPRDDRREEGRRTTRNTPAHRPRIAPTGR
jgi:hypothetical protein